MQIKSIRRRQIFNCLAVACFLFLVTHTCARAQDYQVCGTEDPSTLIPTDSLLCLDEEETKTILKKIEKADSFDNLLVTYERTRKERNEYLEQLKEVTIENGELRRANEKMRQREKFRNSLMLIGGGVLVALAITSATQASSTKRDLSK